MDFYQVSRKTTPLSEHLATQDADVLLGPSVRVLVLLEVTLSDERSSAHVTRKVLRSRVDLRVSVEVALSRKQLATKLAFVLLGAVNGSVLLQLLLTIEKLLTAVAAKDGHAAMGERVLNELASAV